MAALGLCAGEATADVLPWPSAYLALAATALAGLAVTCLVNRKRAPTDATRPRTRRRLTPLLGLVALSALAAQVGVWRMQGAGAALDAGRGEVQRFRGAAQIRGLVADEPAVRGRSTSLTLSNVLVRAGDAWRPLGARVLVNVPHWPVHDYGEYLQLRGKLQPLSGGDAVEALGRQGVLGSMSYPRVSYLANPGANPVLVAMSRLRLALGQTIDQTLPEPAAGTLKATVLGLRSALPKDEQQALVDTGTVHLIVISGFKLSLLAAGLMALASGLLRRTTNRLWARAVASTTVLATIGGYTLLTGATPSAVRAAIMAGLVVVAALAGRPRDQLAALAVAVLAIVGLRPMELLDGGFQLSCLSVLGIVLLSEPLARRLRMVAVRVPGALTRLAADALAEAVAASLAATLFVLPVLAASFHVVSLVSPLANLLGMPLLWPIMVFGGLGALVGSLWAPLGLPLLWPAWAFTSLLQTIVRASAALPYASLAVDGMSPAAVVSWYALLLATTWRLHRSHPSESQRPAPRRRAPAWSLMGAAAAAVAGLAAFTSRPPSTVRATLLAVPGQAALIQTPAGRKVLVDGGQSGPELLRQLGQLLPPWDRAIDLVLVTSPRTDHIAALEEVFARYDVGALVEPEVAAPSATFRRLGTGVQRAYAQGVDIGDGALLRHTETGWLLAQGTTAILIGEREFRISAPDGDWQVLPILPAAGEDGALRLAETGNITVSFGG